jgi:UDP-N-acetylglucosamine 2-epimerase (non-hydrolysing)
MRLLDKSANLTVVHTGQNFDDRLDGLFFRELGVRAPDFHLGIRAESFGDQIGQILAGTEALMLEHRPDRVLILGDTNSGLCAIVARRLGIPVYHMEAGNRCFDDRVPEEVNRRVIDHSSSVLLPYTNRSRDNLLREGIASERILVTGNPIKQVMDEFAPQIEKSDALKKLGVEHKKYFLVTMHRAENVDREDTLRALVDALVSLHKEYSLPVVCSLHPRTKSKLERFGIDFSQAGLKFMEPFGFFDFIRLEKSAFCLISDSGTVQEEACIMGIPNVTIREATERPETVECGSNVLAGSNPERIRKAVRLVTNRSTGWTPPPEYMEPNVAETVVGILTAFRQPDRAEMEWRSGLRFPASPA